MKITSEILRKKYLLLFAVIICLIISLQLILLSVSRSVSAKTTTALAATPTTFIQSSAQQIEVEINKPVLISHPGEIVTYTLTIKNSKNISDTYHIRAKRDDDFNLNGLDYDRRTGYSKPYIEVNPHSEFSIELGIEAPSYATNGMVHETEISVSRSLDDFTIAVLTTVISSPTSIEKVAEFGTPPKNVFAQSVEVVGNYAYLADGYNGLRILDISEPMTPTEVSLYSEKGGAWNIVVKDKHAYIRFGTCEVVNRLSGRHKCSANLYKLDVSNPQTPFVVNAYELPGVDWYGRMQLKTYDDYIYVIDSTGQLHILKASTFEKINEVDLQIGDFDFANDFLYTLSPYGYSFNCENGRGICSDSRLEILDPISLTTINSYQVSETAPAKDLFLLDQYAFIRYLFPCLGVCDSISDRWSIVNSTQSMTQSIATDFSPTQVQNIVKDGNYVYIADGRAGLRILDTSDFNAPREVDAFGAEDMAMDVAVSDGFIFLAHGEGGLKILRYNNSEVSLITSPISPTITSTATIQKYRCK